ncbi:hypothetical protein [Elizabethkingia miricola]|uniref:hypothetical protein n=1 Tax=Elizabethkingia miricola TaxID=172045 RepID=UPI001F1983CE|nr:hypothetical protein [Elizabethkingia miricola]UIO97013.1 hypothetical protein LYZ41_02770 [Elizabethkingia miricola]WER13797.1 hypothetical protein P0M31_02785 [Elizabethkingia miricola]WGL73973.1 hypothetical protein QFB80_02775 [Elizabethkingia miricola]WNG65701.1 hypothetical protein M9H57_02770 [Elizabethkingia miricola]
MKNPKNFRCLINVLIIVAFNTLLIHLLGFEDIIDTQILSIIKHSLILFIGFLFIIIVLWLLLHNENEDVPIPEHQPKEYCVITFYSIVNVNKDQYMHAENSIIISEEVDIMRIQSLGYLEESLPIYFKGHKSSLNIPAIDLVKDLANKKGVSILYDCFTFNFKL